MYVYPGKSDGIWGWSSRTADSVRDYQGLGGIAVTGAINANTYNNLVSDFNTLFNPRLPVPYKGTGNDDTGLYMARGGLDFSVGSIKPGGV